jgi:hypothetical protein
MPSLFSVATSGAETPSLSKLVKLTNLSFNTLLQQNDTDMDGSKWERVSRIRLIAGFCVALTLTIIFEQEEGKDKTA